MKADPTTDRTLHKGAALEKAFERKALLGEAEHSELGVGDFAAAKGIHRSTLWRLRRRAAAGGAAGLVDRRHENPGRPKGIGDQALGWALCYRAAFPKAKLPQVHAELERVAQAQGWKTPSIGQLRGALASLPADLRTLLTDGSRAMFERATQVVRREKSFPNESWQVDCTELPVWCLDLVTGELFKPWLTAVIDGFTRVVLAAVVHRHTPAARDLLLVYRRAFLPQGRPEHPFYGLPQRIQRDNAAVLKTADILDLMFVLSVDYAPIPRESPNANGGIERWFQTCKTQLCTNLLSYAGQPHGLHLAQTQGAVPWPLVQGIVDKFLVRYHTHAHRGLGWQSPWERWHEHLDRAHGLIFDAPRVLAAARFRREATVERDGVFLEDGRRHSSEKLAALIGEKIILRLDPEDPGRQPHAYRADGTFLAVLEPFQDSPGLAERIAGQRLERTVELKRLRKQMRRLLRTLPPVDAPAAIFTAAPRPRASDGSAAASDPPASAAPGTTVPSFRAAPREDDEHIPPPAGPSAIPAEPAVSAEAPPASGTTPEGRGPLIPRIQPAE